MRYVKLMWTRMACVICCILLVGCKTFQTQQTQENPGLYDLTGWNNWDADINGEVGHPLYVDGPRASCRPSHKWSSQGTIISGSLPPGLTMDNHLHISGIPLERGHWIVRLKLDNVQCGGKYYQGFEQELRFHITGSGRVTQ